MTEVKPVASLDMASRPPKPDLTLRIAFAGNREIPTEARPRLDAAVRDIFRFIADRLQALYDQRNESLPDGRPRVARFYSENRPLIRLITGLAEGADELAAGVALELERSAQSPARWETAAVLPFPREEYRRSRDLSFQSRFEGLYAGCAYAVEVDGKYEPDNAVSRRLAYRAQAAVLIRQADLFIALLDLNAAGRAGGTAETLQAALGLGLPSLVLDMNTAASRLIGPDEKAADVLVGKPAEWSATAMRSALRRWIEMQTVDPDLRKSKVTPPSELLWHGQFLLDEFFAAADSVKSQRGKRAFLMNAVKGAGRKFEVFLAGPRREGKSLDEPLEPFERFRKRAAGLNRHYAALYRGAFFVNYGLAVVAVALAVLSLSLIAGSTDWPYLGGVLGVLGLFKLAIVSAIYLNTHKANRERWNERAVDYRYLAERLRSAYYLPYAGIFEPPSATGPRYSAQVVRQSAVDWLFDAIIRHVSPAMIFPKHNELGVCVIRLIPEEALRLMTDHWMAEQFRYHEDNAERMERMSKRTEAWGAFMTKAVIGIVIADLVLAALLHVGGLPESAHHATPWLLFLAAVLPAAVASLNGIAFQSECRRLAERSDVMKDIVKGRNSLAAAVNRRMTEARGNPDSDPGSWSLEVLGVAEATAKEMVNEVAEWSVLYTNVVREPG